MLVRRMRLTIGMTIGRVGGTGIRWDGRGDDLECPLGSLASSLMLFLRHHEHDMTAWLPGPVGFFDATNLDWLGRVDHPRSRTPHPGHTNTIRQH